VNWFALTVKPQHEKAAEMQLEAASIQAYVPVYETRRRWSDRVKKVQIPLFRGYVFSRFEAAERWKVLSFPSVTSVVAFGGRPVPLSDEEIASIQAMAGSGLPLAPCPPVRAGEWVRISAGPLTGVEGIFVNEKSAARVVVNVELLNRAVSVEVDRNSIEAIKTTRPWRLSEPQLLSTCTGINQ